MGHYTYNIDGDSLIDVLERLIDDMSKTNDQIENATLVVKKDDGTYIAVGDCLENHISLIILHSVDLAINRVYGKPLEKKFRLILRCQPL